MRIELSKNIEECLYCKNKATHTLTHNFLFTKKTRHVCKDCGKKLFLKLVVNDKKTNKLRYLDNLDKCKCGARNLPESFVCWKCGRIL